MIELYFVLYRIPKMMSRLAKERNRSAVAWSLLAIVAWFGTEFFVMFGIGVGYGLVALALGWTAEIPGGLRGIGYLVALGSAIGAVTLVGKILTMKSIEDNRPLPPPPPQFTV
jgi:hypothetical protein